MKKTVPTFVFLVVLVVVLVAPAHASVSVDSTVEDNIKITYNLENLDSTSYNETMTNNQFNSSTIPNIIVKNLEKQNLTHVNYDFQPNTYDNATKTIRVSFYLGGSDIISFTINRTAMRKTYQVKTEWRKFQVNLTNSFLIDFTQYFAEPVEKWQKPNQTTYYIETHGTGFFNVLSFKITLPAAATNVQAQGDTITYEIPYFEDVFLNSPFLILAVLILVIIVALIYRRVR